MSFNPNALFCLAVPLAVLAPFAVGSVWRRWRTRRRMGALFPPAVHHRLGPGAGPTIGGDL